MAALDAVHLPVTISIHALREEGDLRPCAAPDLALQFLSTPSARRATLREGLALGQLDISIHALREEGDALGGRSKTVL